MYTVEVSKELEKQLVKGPNGGEDENFPVDGVVDHLLANELIASEGAHEAVVSLDHLQVNDPMISLSDKDPVVTTTTSNWNQYDIPSTLEWNPMVGREPERAAVPEPQEDTESPNAVWTNQWALVQESLMGTAPKPTAALTEPARSSPVEALNAGISNAALLSLLSDPNAEQMFPMEQQHRPSSLYPTAVPTAPRAYGGHPAPSTPYWAKQQPRMMAVNRPIPTASVSRSVIHGPVYREIPSLMGGVHSDSPAMVQTPYSTPHEHVNIIRPEPYGAREMARPVVQHMPRAAAYRGPAPYGNPYHHAPPSSMTETPFPREGPQYRAQQPSYAPPRSGYAPNHHQYSAPTPMGVRSASHGYPPQYAASVPAWPMH